MSTKPQIEVYTDGNCNLCRWMRARVEPLDRDHRIEWLDYNDPEILNRAAPHTREAMAEDMHARDQNGHWTKGYVDLAVYEAGTNLLSLAGIATLYAFRRAAAV